MKDLSLHILDIAENSINAGASLIIIRITERRKQDLLCIEIEDNGRGIPEALVKEILNPFYTTRTTRKIGLGLSLFAQAAKETGGDVAVRSKEGEGTVVTASFRPSHIDMKPLGDLADTLIVLIAGNPEIDFVLACEGKKGNSSFDTRDLKGQLEGVPINTAEVISFIRDHLRESLKEICG